MAKPKADDNAAKLAERDARKWKQGMERLTPVGPQARENYRRAREEYHRRRGK